MVGLTHRKNRNLDEDAPRLKESVLSLDRKKSPLDQMVRELVAAFFEKVVGTNMSARLHGADHYLYR